MSKPEQPWTTPITKREAAVMATAEQRRAVGGRLRFTRHKYGLDVERPGLTIADFAKLLGLPGRDPAGVLGTWERGINEPSLAGLDRVQRLTGVSLTWLITGRHASDPRVLKPMSPDEARRLLARPSDEDLDQPSHPVGPLPGTNFIGASADPTPGTQFPAPRPATEEADDK